MVSISKAYKDLERTKSLINNLHREKAARYIEVAAPEILSNPATADREITTVANLLQTGIDDRGLVEYFDYLAAKVNPDVAEMNKVKRKMNDDRIRMGRWQ